MIDQESPEMASPEMVYAVVVDWHAKDCASGARDADMTIYHTYDRLIAHLLQKFDVRMKART